MRRGNGTLERGTDIDDKLEDLKKRFHLLEGDKKAFYETSQWTLQTNKDRVNTLRSENKDLYAHLSHLQRVVKAHLEGNNEAERMAYQLRELRKKHDEVKRKADEKTHQLAKLKDTMRALVMETPSTGEVGSAAQLTGLVRALEQKIEKASLKHTEALTVKRTYEQILGNLQDDRIGYDSHVNSLEHGVQSKDKELMELTTLYQDAIRSKEIAKEELTKSETLANDDKKHRDQALEEKRQRIKQLMEVNARMERKVKREEQRLMDLKQRAKPTTPTPERDPEFFMQHLKTLAGAYQCVSNLAGVGNYFSDVSSPHDGDMSENTNTFQDIILTNTTPDYDTISQYIQSQGTIARTLETHQAKATARLDALKAERDSLVEMVVNLKLRQLVPTGTRKQVDSYEGRLAQANAAYIRARSKYERAAKANSAIVAGISSLASKLQFVEPSEEFPVVTDQNLSDVTRLCKKKIDHIISAGSLATTPLTPFPPQFTVRVKQPAVPPGPEPDPDESQVPTRVTVKSFSAALVERELKKTKRKQKRQSSRDDERDKRTPPPTSRNYTSPSPTARPATRAASPIPGGRHK